MKKWRIIIAIGVTLLISTANASICIEDSVLHDWIGGPPDWEGTLTDPDNAFDGDWSTYAEVRSNGDFIHAIVANAEENCSVPVGASLHP